LGQDYHSTTRLFFIRKSPKIGSRFKLTPKPLCFVTDSLKVSECIQWRWNEFESERALVHSKSGGGGAPIRRKAPEKIFLVVPLHFLALSRFGERFRDGQYSLVSFLFAVLLLTVLPVSSHF